MPDSSSRLGVRVCLPISIVPTGPQAAVPRAAWLPLRPCGQRSSLTPGLRLSHTFRPDSKLLTGQSPNFSLCSGSKRWPCPWRTVISTTHRSTQQPRGPCPGSTSHPSRPSKVGQAFHCSRHSLLFFFTDRCFSGHMLWDWGCDSECKGVAQVVSTMTPSGELGNTEGARPGECGPGRLAWARGREPEADGGAEVSQEPGELVEGRV